MTAFLLTIALFAAFWLVGIALLSVVVQADMSSPRIVLMAPALGASVAALAAFLLSHFGLPTEDFAVPLTVVLIGAAGTAVAVRRPSLPAAALAVVGICVAGLLIAATPMFSLGFRWMANANDDMTAYSLSAQQLLHHGLASSLDVAGLLRGTDYPTVLTALQRQGERPGGDLLLSVVSALTGRIPYQVYMPLTFSLAMSGVCSAGALAARGRRQWWSASLAAALLAVSAIATYGVLQQLLPQVFGLAVATALLAILLRPEVHIEPADWRREILPIGVLLAASILAFIELASTLALVYGLYLVALARRRELSLSALLRVWLGPAIVAVVLLNTYLPAELGWLLKAANTGTAPTGHPPLFGFVLVPLALPAALGLKPLAASPTSTLVGVSIVIAGVTFIAALAASIWQLWRGSGLAAVLVAYGAFAAYLVSREADYGLFKLMIYVQPFLAAALAVSITRLRARYLVLVAVPLMAFFAIEFSTQQHYVSASRDPGDLINASASDLLPRVQAAVKHSPKPLVVAGANPVFLSLTASIGYGKRVFFIGRDVFTGYVADVEKRLARGPSTSALTRLVRRDEPQKRTFRLLGTGSGPQTDTFTASPGAEQSLASGACTLVVPTGEQDPLNRLSLPGPRNLAVVPCRHAHDLLAFTSSSIGNDFYTAHAAINNVSYYQLQPDTFFAGQTMSGLGRYLLLQVLGPTAGMRLEVNYSFTLIHDGVNAIPPSIVVGSSRVPLPVIGRGSARVISQPLTAQTIDGHPYLLLDVGEPARIHYDKRTGLDALFGSSIPTDERRLTGYLRDISLVSASEYADMRPPLMISQFPANLANPDLEYSGVYEDGWVGRASYFVLGGGQRADLVLHASVPAGAGGRLEVLVNGRRLGDVAASPGPLVVSLPVGASSSSRKVELRFTGLIHLPEPDDRPVSALLASVGFVSPAAAPSPAP